MTNPTPGQIDAMIDACDDPFIYRGSRIGIESLIQPFRRVWVLSYEGSRVVRRAKQARELDARLEHPNPVTVPAAPESDS